MGGTKRDATISGMVRDAQFVGRLISTLRRESVSELAPMVSFCISNFMALFVWESRRQAPYLGPVFEEPLLSIAFDSAIEKSRHLLKMFDHRRPNIAKQLLFFESEIVAPHRRYFLGSAGYGTVDRPRFDLGQCSYQGRQMTSTHVANMSLGMKANEVLNDESGRRVFDLSREYGEFFASRGAYLDSESESFASLLRTCDMQWCDVQSDFVYIDGFNGPECPSLNAWLKTFQMWNDAAQFLFGLDRDFRSTYTVTKLQFLILYAINRSLEVLLSDPPVALTERSRAAVSMILGLPEASTLFSSSVSRMRDAFMHYRPDEALDDAVVKLGEPLYGLTEHYLSGMKVGEFRERVQLHGLAVSNQFDRWSASSGG